MRPLRECSDEELLPCVTIGDQAAFNALVERYAPMMLGVCMDVLRQWQDAEDACQAALLVLWEKANSVQDPQKLSSWLHGVAHNKALNSLKHKQRLEKHDHSSEDGDSAQLAQLAQPKDVLVLRELQVLLREELQRLPERYRLVLVLCYLEGKSKEEAAAELDLPVGTASSRLARARELLRRRQRLAQYVLMD